MATIRPSASKATTVQPVSRRTCASPSGRPAREMKKAGRYIISLELGDSQFDSPREAFYWAKVALSAGLTHYTDVRPTPRRTVEIWMRPLENIR